MNWRAVMTVGLLSSTGSLAGPPATLADLKTLASQGAWAELLEKAEDVPPAERNDEWRALVTDASASGVDGVDATDKEPFAALTKARSLSQRYAFLAKAPPFATARDTAAKKGLEHCLKLEKNDCLDTYLKLAPDVGPDAALDAAHFVRRGHFAYVPMPLYALAVKGAKDAKACKDEGLAETVLAALDLPSTDTRATDAKKVAFDGCWSALTPKLKAGMVGASSYYLKNACQPMRAKKALSELQDDLCKDEGL